MLDKLVENIQVEQVIALTAPPGWGKTYKILNAIRASKKKVVFIFPLRALCDEVYRSACLAGIRTINIYKKKEFQENEIFYYQLILATPECVDDFFIEANFHDYLFVLDEFHLHYYWGDSFRPKLLEIIQTLLTFSPALILLTATFSKDHELRFQSEFKDHYKDVYRIDFGNQKIINHPDKLYFYLNPNWVRDDYQFKHGAGVYLVFCQYRSQVKEVEAALKARNYNVLSCVGGGAKEFIQKLNHVEKLDYIVATSVVSHGVNLPSISRVYFLYNVNNIDFYIQMVGRGGRDKSDFELHTMNYQYFSKACILKGFINVLLKRVSNRIKYFLYYINASRRNCFT